MSRDHPSARRKTRAGITVVVILFVTIALFFIGNVISHWRVQNEQQDLEALPSPDAVRSSDPALDPDRVSR
ncbi:hypothetical protein [Frigidibacter sp. MR17.24]|uniref:hypothetical protein n=1 Tax=Frigidibacter sp. MR17.24 TaxID=3127345 RepID=UPI0030130ECF